MGAGSDLPPAMVQTEDAVQTLIKHLIYSLEVDQEEAVAKQMSSIVLLYNYYHRKQFPKLEFLGFESFCKVAMTSKPSLSKYMKHMSKMKEETNLNKQLSITEKMIMNACTISTSLNDSLNMEYWPISKVAVFLVDVTKQKCRLRSGDITQGIWSLVEKDIESDELVSHLLMKKNESKPEKDSREVEDVLEWLAFSVVKQKTGIDELSLSILEHHITYSLSQDKTTTLLYIMSYIEAVNEEFMEIPINCVLSSLRGPLFTSYVTPEVTPVVDYYHLLPYEAILSEWFARETGHDGNLNGLRLQSNIEEPTIGDHYVADKSDQSEETAEFQINEKPAMGPTIEDHCMNDKSDQNKETSNFLLNEKRKNDRNVEPPEPGNKPTFEDHYMNEKSDRNEQISNHLINEMRKSGHVTVEEKGVNPSVCRPPSLTKKPDDLAIQFVDAINKISSCDVQNLNISNDKDMNDKFDQNKEILEPGRKSTMKDHYMNYNSDQIEKTSNLINQKIKNKTENKTVDLDISIENDTLKNTVKQMKIISGCHNSGSIEVGSNRKSDDSSTNHHIQCPGHAEDIGSRKRTISDSRVEEREMNSHQVFINADQHSGGKDKTATRDLPHSPLSKSENHESFDHEVASKKTDLLQSSLRVLHKKRDELCRQRRFVEDEAAKCEMNIQTILNGGIENSKSSLDLELILEACNDLLSSQTHTPKRLYREERSMPQTKRTRLSEEVFSIHCPCQDLNNICSENGWILPRYGLFPSYSEGKFHARVTVQGLDFEQTCSGEMSSSPREARESAASQLLNKLRDMAGQT